MIRTVGKIVNKAQEGSGNLAANSNAESAIPHAGSFLISKAKAEILSGQNAYA
jgi:hypothetical protein